MCVGVCMCVCLCVCVCVRLSVWKFSAQFCMIFAFYSSEVRISILRAATMLVFNDQHDSWYILQCARFFIRIKSFLLNQRFLKNPCLYSHKILNRFLNFYAITLSNFVVSILVFTKNVDEKSHFEKFIIFKDKFRLFLSKIS